MDYGKIVRRSVEIVWQNKFLILLGFLAAIGSGSIAGSGGGGGGGGSGGGNGDISQLGEWGEEIAALAIGFVVALICIAVIAAVIFWIIGTVARGGLVAGVDDIESFGKSSFRQAWSAGWQKKGTLIGIAIFPAIPGFILLILGLFALTAYGGIFAAMGERIAGSIGAAELSIIAVIACIFAPVMLVLSIVRNFAERACMLEDLGFIDSYRRGAGVLRENLGEAILLFVLQIAISIGLGIVLFIPAIIVVVCCFLWPLAILAQGFFTAAVSALWTLAWRDWTGAAPMVEKQPAAA
jgi:hypothetical protein